MANDSQRFPGLQYAKPGPYVTKLQPREEQQFQSWVKQNKIPFEDDGPQSSYDMRGFWKAAQSGDKRANTAVDPFDHRIHFPDIWKTPYHETFSNESKYATAAAPHWSGDNKAGWKLVSKDGAVVFQEGQPTTPMANDKDGELKLPPGAKLVSDGGSSSSQMALPPGAKLVDEGNTLAPPAPPTTLAQDVIQGAEDVGKGVLRGAGHTLNGIGSALIPDRLVKVFGGTPPTKEQQDKIFAPRNTAEKIGYGGEQAAEFLIPAAGEEKLVSLVPRFKPAARIALQALDSGLINKAQGGDFSTGAVAGGVGGAAGEGLKAAAPKIAETALGIGKTDRAYGRTPGQAIIEETSGVRPSTIEASARAKSQALTKELEDRAAEVSENLQTASRRRPSGLLPAAPTEIPLGPAPRATDVPGELIPAKLSPRRNVLSGEPPAALTEKLGSTAQTVPARVYRPAYLTAGEHAPAEVPPIEGPGVLLTRDPQVANKFIAPTNIPNTPYRVPLPEGAPTLSPALDAIDNEMGKARAQNASEQFGPIGNVRDRLTVNATTGEAIPERVTPTQLLNLKRGVGSLNKSWNPEVKTGMKPLIGNVYNALDSELDRTVPGSDELNQRISSLIPVANRAEGRELEAGVGQRVLARFARPTGALASGLFGGYQGYEHGGLPGAVLGGAAGLVVPEVLASPTVQMIGARTLASPFARSLFSRGVIGSGLQLKRPDDEEDQTTAVQ